MPALPASSLRYARLALPHLVLAALRAAALRSAGVRFLAVARPPLLPNVAAALFVMVAHRMRTASHCQARQNFPSRRRNNMPSNANESHASGIRKRTPVTLINVTVASTRTGATQSRARTDNTTPCRDSTDNAQADVRP